MSTQSTISPEPNAALIFETLNAYQKTAALKTAIELDLFTAIGEGAETSEAIAARCKASARGVRILCDYLTVGGFLLKEGGSYKLAQTAAAFLDRRSPANMCAVTRFINSPKIMSAYTDLTEAVRSGTTQQPAGGATQAEFDEWVVFAESMKPLMMLSSEFIAETAVKQGQEPRRVLDIAASHGTFGIAIARRAPQAEITAQDWPNVLKIAEQNARAAGLADRYHLLPGDAFAVDFEDGYDTVLLTNFLHHFDEPTCESLLRKIHGCLTPGGRLFTLEFVPNEDRVSPPIPATFSLTMLSLTPSGDAYTMKQYSGMLERAGFTRNELLQVPKAPQQLIVSARA